MEQKHTTTSAGQMATTFSLIAAQSESLTKIAALAADGREAPYKAVCHVIGLASYMDALARSLKSSMEVAP